MNPALRQFSQRGETLVGVLVALLIAGIVLSAALTNFSDAWRRAADTKMMSHAEVEARMVLDLINYDLRMIGSGLPLGQTGFSIDDVSLGDSPLPVLVSSTDSAITFRLNESGVSALLASDFTPASSLVVSVSSSTGFASGDTVYISNMSVLGTAGFKGTVDSVSGNSLTLNGSYTSTPSTTFGAGSIIEKVSAVILAATAAGITRDSGGGAITLSPRASFAASYLDSTGTPLALPLTRAAIKDSLSSISITITVTSPHALADGERYEARAIQQVALRNLVLSR
jgi:type II secretory pathway pseudopilin PulG